MLRSALAALLVLAFIPAMALANTSVWASRTVLDEASFTTTVERALDMPAAREALAERLAEELYAALARVDERVPAVLGTVLAGGPDASDDAIVAALRPLVRRALDDPRVREARAELLRSVHETMLRITGGQGSVHIEDDRLVVEVRGILEAVLRVLEPTFGPLAVSLPSGTNVEVVLASSPGLAATSDGLAVLRPLGLVLPLLAVALGLLVLVVARRRSRALSYLGIAIAVAGATGFGLVALGSAVVAGADSQVDPALVTSTYDALSRGLASQSLVLVAGGGVLAVVGVVAGVVPTRRSRRVPGSTQAW